MGPDARLGAANANQRFMAAFEQQDAAGIAELYTEAGQHITPMCQKSNDSEIITSDLLTWSLLLLSAFS